MYMITALFTCRAYKGRMSFLRRVLPDYDTVYKVRKFLTTKAMLLISFYILRLYFGRSLSTKAILLMHVSRY